jgi:energy-coupling factor transporter ATP-binding protein EcfA2
MWENPRPPYPNELYHHGIKGQHWGVRNGPPYPLSSDSSKVDRNPYGLSIGDKAYNLDKWGKSPNTNCLYITGYSGSGKSTLAQKLSKNAQHIELDHYMDNPYHGLGNRAFDRYLQKNNPEWVKIQKNYSSWDKKIFVNGTASQKEKNYFYSARDKILSKNIPEFSKQMYGKSKVIVEGIQIFHPDDWGVNVNVAKALNGKPVVVKGTNKLISDFRGGLRDIRADKARGYNPTLKQRFNMTLGKSLTSQSRSTKRMLKNLTKELR